MRKQEIMADLPKMNVRELMNSRTELRNILRSNPSQSQLNKNEISDITMSISRELTSRAEAKQLKDGDDPKAEQSKLIEGAQAQRKVSINAVATRKLANARETFDNMNGADQFQWMENNGRKNPHQMTIKEFGGSAE